MGYVESVCTEHQLKKERNRMIQKNKIEQIINWIQKLLLLFLGVLIGAYYIDGAIILLILVWGVLVLVDVLSELNMENKR